MKTKFCLSFFFLLSFGMTHAQTVNGVSLKALNVPYLEITQRRELFASTITIDVDYGQYNRMVLRSDSELTGENGLPFTFNSIIDALNLFTTFGYELKEVYATGSDGQVYPHYLLKRKMEIKAEEEIED